MRKISKKLFYYLIFIFWSYIYSQDYLITISGKKYEGQYIRFKDGKVQFIQKGAKHPTDIPSSSVKTVKLANGKTFSFDSKLILNDGTELNGSWIMTSKNFIRFLVTGEKIYTDYDRELVKSITYPDGISMDLDTITDAMFLVTKTKHKDILILGKVDDATAKDNDKKEDKFWTTRKVGNELWIYGKYFGVDFNKGEIQFRGNDGKMYSNPTNVVKIKYDGNTSIDSKTLGILRERSKEILRELLIERCDENKKIKIMVLPFVNDYFGLTKDVIDEMSNACYTIINNQDGLKYLHDNKMKKDELDDYIIKMMGKYLKVDYILYGFANQYDVPFKYSPTSSDPMAILSPLESHDYWFEEIFNSIGRWSVYNQQATERNIAIRSSGSYVALTYYSINPSTGEKLYLLKNETVLKNG